MATKTECETLNSVMRAEQCTEPESDECKEHFNQKFGKYKTHDMGVTITRCKVRCDPYQEYGEHKQQVCDLISAIKENQKVIQEKGKITSKGMMSLGGPSPHRFFYDRDIVHVFDDDTFNNLKNDISIYFKLVEDEVHSDTEAIKTGKSIYSPSFNKQNKNQTYVLVSPFGLELVGKPCPGGSTIPMGSTKDEADLICSTNNPNKKGVFKRPSRGSMFKLFRGGKRSNRKGKRTNGKGKKVSKTSKKVIKRGKKVSKRGKKVSKRSKKVSKRSKNSRKTSKTKKVVGGGESKVPRLSKSPTGKKPGLAGRRKGPPLSLSLGKLKQTALNTQETFNTNRRGDEDNFKSEEINNIFKKAIAEAEAAIAEAEAAKAEAEAAKAEAAARAANPATRADSAMSTNSGVGGNV